MDDAIIIAAALSGVFVLGVLPVLVLCAREDARRNQESNRDRDGRDRGENPPPFVHNQGTGRRGAVATCCAACGRALDIRKLMVVIDDHAFCSDSCAYGDAA